VLVGLVGSPMVRSPAGHRACMAGHERERESERGRREMTDGAAVSGRERKKASARAGRPRCWAARVAGPGRQTRAWAATHGWAACTAGPSRRGRG
jgi:hypothetical protein